MGGEQDLKTLLGSMQATLAPDLFVFVTLKDQDEPPTLTPMMRFEEAEGTTLIVKHDDAVAENLAFEFPCRMITLNVHSALDAIGFLAAITTTLAKLGMGVNPVSGFFHDHLFVPDGRQDDAMAALETLAKSNR